MQTFSVDDSTISVRRGERFCIVAPATPTAGYQWSAECDGPGVVKIESTFDIAGSGIGGGATQRITFEPRDVGSYTLRFAYSQAGAAAPESVRTIAVTVT